jgi:RNA polymerase sigma-70 factor (ECF subfamily)
MKHWQREKTYSTRFLKEYFTLKENEGMYELAQIPTEDKTAWVRLQCDECLTGIVHCLNNEDRMTYLLRVAGRLPFADIAEILEKEEPALRKSFERSRKKVSGFLNSQCFLYNPGGDCRCKIKEPIKHTDKKKEYKTVQQAARKMHFLEAADSYYPGHDYWKGLIAGLK